MTEKEKAEGTSPQDQNFPDAQKPSPSSSSVLSEKEASPAPDIKVGSEQFAGSSSSKGDPRVILDKIEKGESEAQTSSSPEPAAPADEKTGGGQESKDNDFIEETLVQGSDQEESGKTQVIKKLSEEPAAASAGAGPDGVDQPAESVPDDSIAETPAPAAEQMTGQPISEDLTVEASAAEKIMGQPAESSVNQAALAEEPSMQEPFPINHDSPQPSEPSSPEIPFDQGEELITEAMKRLDDLLARIKADRAA